MESGRKAALRVLRAQSGNRQALEEIFEELQGPLFGFIRSIVAERALAEDVLQDVFVLIYRKLVWLRDPSLLRPWAYRIASREAVRRVKRERRFQPLEEEPAEALPDPDITDPDMRHLAARLPELIQHVSPASRVVLGLHYLEELSLPEVAAVLGIPVGTAKSRLAYGLTVLRKELECSPCEERNDP